METLGATTTNMWEKKQQPSETNLRFSRSQLHRFSESKRQREPEEFTEIDERDKQTPDNWVSRNPALIRLTGDFPMNAEPPLHTLMEEGLITPGSIHYVRNHGAVPKLSWGEHRLQVDGLVDQPRAFSMDELLDQFAPARIDVTVTCDGNRRKELNSLRHTRGFNWGSGATSTSAWKGVLLADVLQACGVQQDTAKFICFTGSDKLAHGKYGTSIPAAVALDRNNDILLAYEMNDQRLLPDHGFPLRVIIPGYVGGRMVKWLARIDVTDKESDSWYHYHDNRVLPSSIGFAEAGAEAPWRKPEYMCTELNINSVITAPAHDEWISMDDVVCKHLRKKAESMDEMPNESNQEKAPKEDPAQSNTRRRATAEPKLTEHPHARFQPEQSQDEMFKLAGYAYSGGGRMVTRVEISLDNGKNWFEAERQYPEGAVRHGCKYWTWCHWICQIPCWRFLYADDIIVRAFDTACNTQPAQPTWNLMGMMNNSWHRVKVIREEHVHELPSVTFRHPVLPGAMQGGYMDDAETRHQAETLPSPFVVAAKAGKLFSLDEVAKHNTPDDCWAIIDREVYDLTSYMSDHPGGSAVLLLFAGKDATDVFFQVHGADAKEIMNYYRIGLVVQRDVLQQGFGKQPDVLLDPRRWQKIRVAEIHQATHDVFDFVFDFPDAKTTELGLPVGQHVLLGMTTEQSHILARPYTPTCASTSGKLCCTIKFYEHGALTQRLAKLKVGDHLLVKGPAGPIIYHGRGKFTIQFQTTLTVPNVGMIAGGTGITPMLQLIRATLSDEQDPTNISLIFANRTVHDILCKQELDEFARKYPNRFRLWYTVSMPPKPEELDGGEWEYGIGYITEKMIRDHLFAPSHSVTLCCGPPAMVEHAGFENLRKFGFHEQNMFEF